MSFSTSIVNACDLDVAAIPFGEVKKYPKSQIPYVPVLYEGKVLILRTPSVHMPFGVSVYSAEGGKDDVSIPINFNDADPVFLEKMQGIDERVLDAAVERSQKWFGKQKSRDTLDDNQNKIVKIPKKEEYGLSMKAKWPMVGGAEPTFWEAAEKPGEYRQVDADTLKPHSTGSVIMELRPLYQVQGKFGLKWVVKQVLIESRPEEGTACGFGKVAQIEAPELEEELPEMDDDGDAL